MNKFIDLITRRNFLILAAVIGAAVVSATGHDGWGWLIVFAFIALN